MKVQKVVTLDKKDNIILEMLIVNARVTYSALAKATQLFDVACKNRISRLQEKGIIEQFTIILRDDIDLNKDLNVISLDVPSGFEEDSQESVDDCDE